MRLERYLSQSHISEKNLSRLNSLAQHADPEIREFATLIRDIGIATPYRRRRFKRLAREHRDLLARYNAFFGNPDYAKDEEEWLAMMEESLKFDEFDELGELDEEDAEALPDRMIVDPFA